MLSLVLLSTYTLLTGGVGDSLTHEDSLRERQLVQVSPHVVRFDQQTRSATLEFRNPSDSARQAVVQVQFAYPDWPHGRPSDTVIIAQHMELIDPHDTVVANPGPNDHFAGRWLSGVPTSVALGPHQTKQVTIHISPPADLAAGEYWARIVSIVHPYDPKHPGGQDVKQHYNLPTKGRAPLLQDTCAVIYRQGTLQMGLKIDSGAVAVIDSANLGDVDKSNFSHALWVRLPLKLTGNVPFVGQMHSTYHNLTTGEDVRPDTKEYSLYKSAVVHWTIETDVLPPGKYTLTLKFDNDLSGVPAAQRVPMTPVEITLPFEIKPAWAY